MDQPVSGPELSNPFLESTFSSLALCLEKEKNQ